LLAELWAQSIDRGKTVNSGARTIGIDDSPAVGKIAGVRIPSDHTAGSANVSPFILFMPAGRGKNGRIHSLPDLDVFQ
jgi:hypothetical protein